MVVFVVVILGVVVADVITVVGDVGFAVVAVRVVVLSVACVVFVGEVGAGVSLPHPITTQLIMRIITNFPTIEYRTFIVESKRISIILVIPRTPNNKSNQL